MPVLTSVGPAEIRHAQITFVHDAVLRQHPGLPPAQIAERLAATFKHSAPVNLSYKRQVFHSLLGAAA